MSLQSLPYEVVSIITQSLDLEDLFHLALSCQRFQYLIRDDRSCKVFLENLASGTSEFQEAKSTNDWARAVRRLVKRRQAIRAAAPYTAAIVAVAESWLYKGGVLCYIQDRTLRVLDLHRAGTTETVLDLRSLLREEFGENRQRKRYKLRLLHYAEGLLTCLHTRARESWLIVLHVPGRRVMSVSPTLESTHKIFVRNDTKFLYYGTQSEYGEDGHRRWVLMSYNICQDEWLDQKIHLMDMVGSDIDQSICFEIIDGHFYGLSNQTSFEVDEVDWTSFYHCFCFPVGNSSPSETQRSIRDKMWRRQHAEGPIDDRWSFLRLIKNEETGKLQILESRKEWLRGRSSSQRTYYTTDLALGPTLKADNDEEGQTGVPSNAPESTAIPNNPTHSMGYSSTNDAPPDSARLTSGTRVRNDFTLPTKLTTRPRDPHKTHIGDDASTALLFTFSKCPVRSYHAASQTFLDLVEDPFAAKPQLKLRAGARHALPASALSPDSPAFDKDLPHTERIKHLYKDSGANEIVFWPPKPEGPDAGALNLLEGIMNPPSHMGNVHGTWDERSCVYSTGSNADGVQALIFLGFDPAIKLRGLQEWDRYEGWCESATKQHEDGVSTVSNVQDMLLHTDVCGEPGFEANEACRDKEHKGKEVAKLHEADDFAAMWATEDNSSPQTMIEYSSGGEELGGDENATWSCSSPIDMPHLQQPHLHESAEGEAQWARVLPAMYQEICFGFNGLPDFTNHSKINAAGNIG
ncbi:hypothetical protein N0V93_000218 [Gnomoniopsis smithogilvyi]|uniref:F-box domain-containing protein n=1 Tax=Gnomoniopsis smithogilvyi TaxID=1191159 RepID=A0A9W9D011_9PEZI|nr:hypothetical protein N0V93_000218 [Gnomoniopsis smithogilvyi]